MITIYLYCEVCGRFYACYVSAREMQSLNGITVVNCAGDPILNTVHERAVPKVVAVETPFKPRVIREH